MTRSTTIKNLNNKEKNKVYHNQKLKKNKV
jgi:hypothetical protein